MVIHNRSSEDKVVHPDQHGPKHGCTQFSIAAKSLIKKGKMTLSTEMGVL
jgi:hypothetical protein